MVLGKYCTSMVNGEKTEEKQKQIFLDQGNYD